MTTDLFTEDPVIAALKARNKKLRARLKQQTEALQSMRKALVGMHLAMEAVGEGAFHGDMLEREEQGHDNQ